MCVFVCARVAVLSDYDSADPEENGSHSEVKHINWSILNSDYKTDRASLHLITRF